MKKNIPRLLSILLVFLTLFQTYFIQCASLKVYADEIQTNISIDGNISDWSNVQPIIKGSGSITSISCIQENFKIYILIEGTNL